MARKLATVVRATSSWLWMIPLVNVVDRGMRQKSCSILLLICPFVLYWPEGMVGVAGGFLRHSRVKTRSSDSRRASKPWTNGFTSPHPQLRRTWLWVLAKMQQKWTDDGSPVISLGNRPISVWAKWNFRGSTRCIWCLRLNTELNQTALKSE